MKEDGLRIIVEENHEALSEKGAVLFEQSAIEAVEKRGNFYAALSGGSTPREMHRRLASRSSIPWQGVHLFWGDERCVPVSGPSSNYGTAWVDFLREVPLPAERIHPMPGHMAPEQGALSYERALQRLFDLKPGCFPLFDLIFLGLGRDGHTASLLPGHQSLDEEERLVVAVRGGDPDVDRLTLTFPVINRAREVILMVSGVEKAGAVKGVIQAEDRRLPATRVRPASGMMIWLLDREAASLLSGKTLSEFL